MKLRNLFMAVVAGAAMLVGCNKEVDLGPAKLALDQTTLAFEAAGGSQTVSVTATRDWAVSGVPDWVALSATSGKAAVEAQPVKITVAQNAEYNRSATIVFTIGFARTSLTINQAGPEGEIDNGDGTLENPFNVAGVLEYTRSLPADQASENNVFFQGKISKVTTTFEASSTYGNATFYVVDEDGGESFYVYQTYYLGNRKWKSGDTDVKEGDEVIICGKVVNFKGNTPETVSKGGSFIYSLNGKSEGGAPGDDDYTKAEAKTVAEFIQLADETKYYKLTGKVSKFNKTYCSFDLTDDSGTIYVFSVLDAYKTDEWKNKIKNGGTITIAGKYEYYASKEQHEVVNAAILEYSDGEGGDEDYSKAEAKTVAEFIQLADKSTYYKLTGTVSKFNPTYCSFDLTDASGTIYVYSVLAAYKTDEWKNKIKNGGTITIAGKYEYYANKSQHEVVDAAILEYTDGEGGGDDYRTAASKTVEEFIQLADKSTYYKLTGTVSKFNPTYCSFDLTDASGTIYVYSVLAAYKTDEWKNKIKDGGTITIAGKYEYYANKSQHEVVDAAILEYTDGQGGGDEPGGNEPEGGIYASSVTWTLGDKAYSEKAIVNDVENVPVLKLGTSSKIGTATLTIPSGATKITFYAVSWSGKPSKLVFKNGDTELGSVSPAANTGLANSSPYTLTVTDADKYEIAVSGATSITVQTDGSNKRAALFAIVSE